MSSSLLRPISMIGVMQAGGSYVPIDPAAPWTRIKYIINDANIGTGFHLFMILRECIYQLEVYVPRYGQELEQAKRLQRLAVRRFGGVKRRAEAEPRADLSSIALQAVQTRRAGDAEFARFATYSEIAASRQLRKA